jgi:cyclophilin family peptidyl-prolyl cis-trans isomerase
VPNQKRARQKASRQHKLEAQRRVMKKKQLMRRVVIVTIVAVLFIGSVLLFVSTGHHSNNASTTTSTSALPTTTSTTALPTTSTTFIPLSATAARADQVRANALAVAAGCPRSTATRVNTLQWSSPPAMTINKNGQYYVHMVTTAGTMVIHLLPKKAPITVNNFVFLAQHNYYNCVIFHRVIPGFVIQGGDPTGTGEGGPGYKFDDELPPTGNPTYPLYSVAMANAGANTNGSQFFIITGPSGEQLPASYSLFGQVVVGQNVAAKINDEGSTAGVPPTVTQRMLRVTISSVA